MQKLQLSIPEPCHENWQNMTPTEQGRFCNACAKEVVDFSMMTDREVLNYFTTVTYDKVCGRALPAQLDRTISMPKDPKKRLFWYWNYVVMFFMFFSKSNYSKAQIKGEVVTVPVKKDAGSITLGQMVAGVNVTGNNITSGKIIDEKGNPIPFASIKIKNAKIGTMADDKGNFSIKANKNDFLQISAVGFKMREIAASGRDNIKILLENWNGVLGGAMVVVAGNDQLFDKQKHAAVLEVKDDVSGSKVDKAKIIITKNNSSNTAFTDKKGTYKLKGIKEDDKYYIKIEAGGYEANEFTISGKDFRDKKKVWEVFLTKTKSETTEAQQPIIRMGAVSALSAGKAPVYVVDGKIASNADDINPDDIANITVLKAAEAGAIFGPEGSNGAVVITTRMAKTKNLDAVVVSSVYLNKALSGRVGGFNVRPKVTKYADIKTRIITKLTDSLKIYPNPVQKGVAFSVSLKLKQTGTYNIQVADATGRIVLQKQTNIPSKQYIEQLQADSRWGSGVYYIRVFNNNNKLISKNSFVVQ